MPKPITRPTLFQLGAVMNPLPVGVRVTNIQPLPLGASVYGDARANPVKPDATTNETPQSITARMSTKTLLEGTLQQLSRRAANDDLGALGELADMCLQQPNDPTNVELLWLVDLSEKGERVHYQEYIGTDLWHMSDATRTLKEAVSLFMERNADNRDVLSRFHHFVGRLVWESSKKSEQASVLRRAIREAAATSGKAYEALCHLVMMGPPESESLFDNELRSIMAARGVGVDTRRPDWYVEHIQAISLHGYEPLSGSAQETFLGEALIRASEAGRRQEERRIGENVRQFKDRLESFLQTFDMDRMMRTIISFPAEWMRWVSRAMDGDRRIPAGGGVSIADFIDYIVGIEGQSHPRFPEALASLIGEAKRDYRALYVLLRISMFSRMAWDALNTIDRDIMLAQLEHDSFLVSYMSNLLLTAWTLTWTQTWDGNVAQTLAAMDSTHWNTLPSTGLHDLADAGFEPAQRTLRDRRLKNLLADVLNEGGRARDDDDGSQAEVLPFRRFGENE